MNRFALTLALTLTLLACGGKGPASSPPADAQPASQAVPPAASPHADAQASPGGPAPLSSRGEPVSASPDGGAGNGAGLDFDLPAGWQAQPVRSSMRFAQALIPGSGGTGELAVFFFGVGGGGGLEANIDRWVGQVEGAGQPKLETFTANGLKITWVEVLGTLKAGQMGMGPASDQPGFRLYGAVVEGPGGPWFFKATGPDATLTAERDHWLAMLKSARATG